MTGPIIRRAIVASTSARRAPLCPATHVTASAIAAPERNVVDASDMRTYVAEVTDPVTQELVVLDATTPEDLDRQITERFPEDDPGSPPPSSEPCASALEVLPG